VATYRWSFGGVVVESTDPVTEHTFAADGTYAVSLEVVTAVEALTDTTTPQNVTVSSEPSADTVGFVDAASSGGNRTSHVVRIPSDVRAGDRLVLFLTLNGSTSPVVPAGWSLVDQTDGNAFTGRVWTKVATAADANANVVVSTPTILKSAMSVAAYRSSTGSVEIGDVRSASLNGATSLTVPPVSLGGGALVVGYVGLKNSSAVSTALPSSLVSRSSVDGSGAGAAYSVLADSDEYLSGGSFGGTTVSFSVTATRSLYYLLSLKAV